MLYNGKNLNSLFDAAEAIFDSAIRGNNWNTVFIDTTAPEQIEVELPGVSKEKLKLERECVGNDLRLCISAINRRGETITKRWRINAIDVDVANIKAALQDGLLTITLPRLVKKKEEKTEIKIE